MTGGSTQFPELSHLRINAETLTLTLTLASELAFYHCTLHTLELAHKRGIRFSSDAGLVEQPNILCFE